MIDEFFDADFTTFLMGRERSTVENAGLMIDTRKTGAYLTFEIKDKPRVTYFVTSPVAADFGKYQHELATKAGFRGERWPDFLEQTSADTSIDISRRVHAIRTEFFPRAALIALLLEDGAIEAHAIPGDLASALADELRDAVRSGQLLDLRAAGNDGRPQ